MLLRSRLVPVLISFLFYSPCFRADLTSFSPFFTSSSWTANAETPIALPFSVERCGQRLVNISLSNFEVRMSRIDIQLWEDGSLSRSFSVEVTRYHQELTRVEKNGVYRSYEKSGCCLPITGKSSHLSYTGPSRWSCVFYRTLTTEFFSLRTRTIKYHHTWYYCTTLIPDTLPTSSCEADIRRTSYILCRSGSLPTSYCHVSWHIMPISG